MTDRQDHEFSQAREPDGPGAGSAGVPDPPADAPRHADPFADARSATSAPFGDGAPARGEDSFGSPDRGGSHAVPEFGAPPAGGSEEPTVAVPPRSESTGPTTALSPDRGGRPTQPPPPPPGYGPPPSPPPGYGPPTQQITPEMMARARGLRETNMGQAPGPDPRQGPPQWAPARPGTPYQQQWNGPPPPGQRLPGPPPGPPQGRPGQQPPPGPWGETSGGWPAEGFRSGAAPANFNYTDSIRSSDLVPTRKLPPRHGWRKGVLLATFGLVNLGRSPDERRHDDLVAKTRTLLRGRYKIGVLGKGGTGKTTLAASLGSILAELRQDDRVVAIDADTAFGKLASRIDPQAAGSYWELAADQHLHSFADVRSRVGSNAAGLFVLGGEHNVARRRVLDPAIYREAASRLDNHFTISIVDCGSTMDSPVTQEALSDLDALLVVSSPWLDGASAAGQTLEWLANNGYTGLLHRTVIVLNDSDGHADKRTRKVLLEQFGARGQVVVEVPYDQHLRPGGVIDVDTQIDRVTRRRILEIAAAVAEHFAATTDGPRERR
ncbi:MinD/ParA family protein [Mycolicibacterium sp. P1-18]|uniref:MinD/ParA family ATP-binding protein n=1 Tax=Mycolicibacterium sp. P1-18 TaxID=2024615 RepID=UPI0011F1A01E|nr:MinD/ParA family protein [Mycolicibacterium sp. P1-18]KAA0093695.1 MinD/ParA family protein [Mycolicibacterium sp. P1-18]